MMNTSMRFSPPRWAATRWLTEVGRTVPDEIRAALVSSLYGTLPIFAGGVVNTVGVALLVAARHPTLPFRIWAVGEILLCLVRLGVLVTSFRRARSGRATPTDAYVWLGVLWAASVGYGAFITIGTGDWVASALTCLSSAAMVGGICFRNFGAPRMAGLMIVASLGPVMIACIASGEPILLVTGLQIPFYVFSMTVAAYRLNAMLVRTMRAERDNDHRATHDALTGLANRAGLERAFAARADTPAALLYLDLNGFKAVNDRLGHAAGDALLAQVAARLREATAPGDTLARIGGDEFVVLSWGLDAAGAERAAERIARRLTAVPFAVADTLASIGTSIGVATDAAGAPDLQRLLLAADQALYRAKAEGGGCRLAEPAPQHAYALRTAA